NNMAPTLTKKAGGALKLSFPFEIRTKKKKGKKLKAKAKILGGDLGLKTLVTISVVERLEAVKQKTKLSKEDFDKLFEGIDIGAHESARYFLDQEELAGKASDWWIYPKGSRPFFNFKKKLILLRQKERELKSQRDNFKKKHKNYRQKKQFFVIRREWKRIWQKIKNIHQEVAKQVATRVVQLARFHEVTLIRFENLKWSSHSPKEKVGYWLSTWQTHWFHSEIIRNISQLASRFGIKFELVNARNTSKRCSKCGKIGERKSKSFVCNHCQSPSGPPRQLDSDLNAARNITIAPLPLSHWRKRKPPVPGIS
ncbi:MAG: transposase, partial [Candidatus Heimdallarchaeota archaeon]|nr:transposase [Candidatus Heimdallarchaeota archaeon]MCK5050027.1 transposase [Candidatus Heimdallarchaeota archaeon]